jgi:hypothetical protein
MVVKESGIVVTTGVSTTVDILRDIAVSAGKTLDLSGVQTAGPLTVAGVITIEPGAAYKSKVISATYGAGSGVIRAGANTTIKLGYDATASTPGIKDVGVIGPSSSGALAGAVGIATIDTSTITIPLGGTLTVTNAVLAFSGTTGTIVITKGGVYSDGTDELYGPNGKLIKNPGNITMTDASGVVVAGPGTGETTTIIGSVALKDLPTETKTLSLGGISGGAAGTLVFDTLGEIVINPGSIYTEVTTDGTWGPTGTFAILANDVTVTRGKTNYSIVGLFGGSAVLQPSKTLTVTDGTLRVEKAVLTGSGSVATASHVIFVGVSSVIATTTSLPGASAITGVPSTFTGTAVPVPAHNYVWTSPDWI